MPGPRRLITCAVAAVCAAAVSGCSHTTDGTGSHAGLAGYLIAAPSGSERGTSTWARTTSPSVAAYARHFFDPDEVAAELHSLHDEEITGVAHVLWTRHDLQVDVVLLRSANPTGAFTRHTFIVAAAQSQAGMLSTRPAIAGDAIEFHSSSVDDDGDIASRAYAVKGDIELEIFSFSPRTSDEKDLTAVTATQLAKLP